MHRNPSQNLQESVSVTSSAREWASSLLNAMIDGHSIHVRSVFLGVMLLLMRRFVARTVSRRGYQYAAMPKSPRRFASLWSKVETASYRFVVATATSAASAMEGNGFGQISITRFHGQ